MRRPSISRLALTTAAAATALAAVACTNRAVPGPGAPEAVGHPNLSLVSALESFSSCDDVLDHFKTEAKERVTEYGLQGYGYGYGAFAGGASDQAAVPAPGSPAGRTANAEAQAAPTTTTAGVAGSGAADAPEHSDTNVQEKGVDEPDTTKTDGTHLYTVVNGTLYVFTVDDGIPTQAGTLALGRSGNQQLLLSGDKLLVLSKAAGAPRPGGPIGVEGSVVGSSTESNGTEVVEVDASDPAHPKATSELSVDGAIVDARMVNGTARVVVTSSPQPLSFVRPTEYNGKGTQQALSTNRRIIDESTLADWLPTYSIAGSTDHKQLVDCNNVSHPKQFGGFGTVTVLSVTIGQGISPRNSVAVQADADKVYASTNHLYVSTNRLPDPDEASDGVSSSGTAPPATTGTRGRIDCDPACPPPDPIPTTTRPPSPVPPQQPDYRTAIHEFDISGTGPASYLASGEVRGHLLNEFAMSEDHGYLRLATTDGPPWGATSSDQSYVTVVQEDHGELKQVGQVGGMGKGEQIRSVRFIGSTGYVVTFRRTDPLYTVDLRDPKNPTVAGELTLLGYSAYLHPVGDGLLLGIGQDATSRGTTFGTQVALFDVSDPARPTLLRKVTAPGGSSDVEQDYHAFLWWDPSHLALMPVQQYQPRPCPSSGDCGLFGATDRFVGVVGLTVDRDGIELAGRIVNPGDGSVDDGGQPPCPAGAVCATSGPTVGRPSSRPTTTTTEPELTCETAGACSSTSTTSSTGAPSTTSAPGSSTTSTEGTSSTPSSSASSSTSSASTSTTLRPVPDVATGAGAPIDRAVVIGDHVLTISAGGILVSDLHTLSPVTWVPFS